MSFITEVHDYAFNSQANHILPGARDYTCIKHKIHYPQWPFESESLSTDETVSRTDLDVLENKSFSYQIICLKGTVRSDRITLLFHGFNEKDWAKYIPWANAICENTGNSVLLFPIAFHMQRAPRSWSNPRAMYALSKKRKQTYPSVRQSSLSNVAISTRIHTLPQRFIWSGLQSYYDVIQLLEECKSGKHPFVSSNAKFDIFAYSIGGFLALTLKLCNYSGYFAQSRVCLFCSGAALKDLAPVSKFILDSEAYAALYAYVISDFQNNLQKDDLLAHYLGNDHLEGQIFSSLFETGYHKTLRNDLLKACTEQIYAIGLAKDTVIPIAGIRSLLQGEDQEINIRVDVHDFARNYTHEDPFSYISVNDSEARQNCKYIFEKVCSFLGS
ncbi:MAG: DUF6051 family protein [Candidatus Cloacimonetes bacterium]|jgi:hypothetical protein|nr:DUF6051 family protein [Candidatus Cloacimonadota bacterium]MDY0299676.1 DUF6051 family protein [Candidatus Cloacimonadaceae bacterium]